MKKLFIPLIAGMAVCCLVSSAQAQESQDHISKEFTVDKTATGATVFIYNFSGFVKVEGYSGDKVLLEIDKRISAEDTAELETGKKEVRLAFQQKGDSIIAYMAEPFDTRPHDRMYQGWNDDRHIYYKFNIDYTIKVPYNMNLVISTVTNGAITIKDVAGKLKVNNVSGAVNVVNARGATTANTVSGELVVSYLSNPPAPCFYRSISGNITVSYPSDLSADLEFKSMHANYYTDFPDFTVLPALLVKNEEKRGGATMYKMERASAIRIGAGGKTFKFETLSAHIYIKKQS